MNLPVGLITRVIPILGQGVYPSVDMNGECLQGPRREKACRRICGKYTVVLDAFQMDQEFISKCFRLQRVFPAV